MVFLDRGQSALVNSPYFRKCTKICTWYLNFQGFPNLQFPCSSCLSSELQKELVYVDQIQSPINHIILRHEKPVSTNGKVVSKNVIYLLRKKLLCYRCRKTLENQNYVVCSSIFVWSQLIILSISAQHTLVSVSSSVRQLVKTNERTKKR